LKRACCAVALSIASLTVSRPAEAQDEKYAEALFTDAQRLVAAGRVHEACAKFAESERLDPATGTLLATAACHEKDGKLATAWAEFTDAVTMAQKAHEPAREKYARTHAQKLEGTLYRVTIDLPAPPPGTTLTVDGRALTVAALGTPLPLDPGHHQVEVKAPGRRAWTRDVEVPTTAGTGRLTAVLEVGPEGTASTTSSPATEPASVVAPVIVGASGGALVVAGVVMVAVAAANGSAANTAARNAPAGSTAYDNAESEHNSAITLQSAGLVVGGIGVAALALGTGWFVKIKYFSSPQSGAGAATLTPRLFPVGSHGAGLGLGGTF